MGLQCGIVGLPNVGKSTLFNALTKAQIDASNYPFCTIEPNVGVVPVPDQRLNQLAEITKPQKILPATVEFVDIAGLVKGASKGEGLGNQFLANIRETDAILQVARCFENDDIVHVSGSVDPIRDIEIINEELILADLDSVSKALRRVERNAKSGDKTAVKEKALLQKLEAHLDSGNCARTLELEESEQDLVKQFHLLTIKPQIYIANVLEDGFDNNALLSKLEEYAAAEGTIVVPICAAIEAEIAELDEADKAAFLEELGFAEAGLDRLIRASFELLHLQSYFTAGPKEVRAWTIPVGASAPQAAGVIHTDFERGFIRANVISFDDYINYKGESGAKDAGKLRAEGKAYTVVDGDVIHFLFNV